MVQTKEVVKKKTAVPATMNELAMGEATGEQIIASDMPIPRILCMQGTSELVGARKAQIGDIVRSTSAEKIGEPGQPFSIIPLTYTSKWMNQEYQKGSTPPWQFRGMEPRTSLNQDSPLEFEKNGTTWRRMKVIELFGIIPADIEADIAARRAVQEQGILPDLNQALMPVCLTFQSTGFKAGKEIVNHFSRCRQFGVKPYAYTLTIDSEERKKESNTWYVFKVNAKATPTAPDALTVANSWYEMIAERIAAGDINVDEADPETGSRGSAANTGDGQF